MSAKTPDVSGMLTCLGCHDGNIAPAAMMKNKVYENLPATYGNRNSIPTLMASSGARKLHQRSSDGTERHHRLRRNVRLGLHRGERRHQHERICFQPVCHQLRLLRKARRLQQQSCRRLHHLPRPALDECGHRRPQLEFRVAAGTYATMFFLRAPTIRTTPTRCRTRQRNSAVSVMPTSQTR